MSSNAWWCRSFTFRIIWYPASFIFGAQHSQNSLFTDYLHSHVLQFRLHTKKHSVLTSITINISSLSSNKKMWSLEVFPLYVSRTKSVRNFITQSESQATHPWGHPCNFYECKEKVLSYVFLSLLSIHLLKTRFTMFGSTATSVSESWD